MTQPTTFGTTPNVYRYTSQQVDSATGLYDLRARYYNPGEGRFLSQDTWPVDVNNPVELNRYVYTADNPINGSDPSGNFLAGYVLNLFNFSLKSTAILTGISTVAFMALLLVIIAVLPDESYEALADASKPHRVCSKEHFPVYCTFVLSKEQTDWLANRAGGFVGQAIALFVGKLAFGLGTGIAIGLLAVELDGVLNDIKDKGGRLGFIVFAIPPLLRPFKII